MNSIDVLMSAIIVQIELDSTVMTEKPRFNSGQRLSTVEAGLRCRMRWLQGIVAALERLAITGVGSVAGVLDPARLLKTANGLDKVAHWCPCPHGR
jgi:hypothetical protein